MCGIGGMYKMGEEPIQPWQISMMAQMLEERGNDATGVCLVDMQGNTRIFKNNEPAWKFTVAPAFKNFLSKWLDESIRIVLVHTRKYTRGHPSKNENNHPITAGEGVIIHNGMITNDDDLFRVNKDLKAFKRSCETDSDAIRAFLDNWGRIDAGLGKEMSKLQGVAAIAATHPGSPDKLLLLRDSNPLVIGATPDFLAFASTKKAIHAAMKPWVKQHGIAMQVHAPDLSFLPMPNQTAWIIGPDGLEDHARFSCNVYHRQGNLKYQKSCDYHERQGRTCTVVEPPKKVQEQAPVKILPASGTSSSGASSKTVYDSSEADLFPNFVICPKESCSQYLELNEDDRKVASLDFLACPTCATTLGKALSADVN